MSRPQSKEELRAARLRALQAKMPNAAAAIEASTHEQSTPSQHHDIPVSTTQTSPTTTTTTKVTPILNATLFQALLKLVYVGGEATDEDLLRWTNEGFRFCPEPNFGLRQGHGGPCGILAVTQAEMVKELFFTEQGAAKYLSLPELSNVEVEIALVRAMSNILLRARPNSNDDVHVLAVTDDTNVNKVLRHWNIGAMELHSYSSKEDLFTALHSMLQQFRGQSGCILFLLSLVLTRSVYPLILSVIAII